MLDRDEEINVLMNALGYFKGVETLVRDKKVTLEEAANLRAYAFKRMGVKVTEIRQEIVKLQGVVQILESVCRQGSQVKPLAAGEAEIASLRHAVKQLHGWTMSLVESDHYFLSRAENPSDATAKFNDLAMHLFDLTIRRHSTHQNISGKGRIPI